MLSAVSIGLKSVGLALAVGSHGDPRQRKEWCRERELSGLKNVGVQKFKLNTWV